LLQVSLVHSWDASDQGAIFHAATVAALRTRAASALPSLVWKPGSWHTPVLEAPLASLDAAVRWLTQQEVLTRACPACEGGVGRGRRREWSYPLFKFRI
jgi:hypothetical protein